MRFARIAAALVLTLGLSGCIKMNMALKVNANDTVSGSAILAVSKQLADQGTDSTFSGKPGLLKGTPGVKVTHYDDGKFVGSSYTFDSVPLAKFQTSDQGSSGLRIVREGDDIVVSGNIDMTDVGTGEPDNPYGASMIKLMASSMDLKVSISLPGKIVSTNGAQEGNTITWTLDPTGANPIAARSSAPKPSAGAPWLTTALAAGSVIAIAGTVWTVRRRRKSVVATPAAGDESTVPISGIDESNS